jgi:hypothetical protein
MSLFKAARYGATYGEIAGPEGEVIGAGIAAAAQLASDIYRHYSSSSEDSKESEPLITIQRPGIAQIHPNLRQRTPAQRNPSAFIPPQDTSPFPSSHREAPTSGQPTTASTPTTQTNNDSGRINVRTIDRYGRRPLLAGAALAGAAAVAGAPSTESSQQKVNVNPEQPEPGEATPTHLPRPLRPSISHSSLQFNQPIFGLSTNTPYPNSTRVNPIKRYVGNYKFPSGAYNYVDYNKYTQNNTIQSLI